MDTISVAGRHDLTDMQWAVLEPLLPPAQTGSGRRCSTKRQLIDGIRWRVRAGTPWRDVPAATGLGRRCMGCFGGGSAMAPGGRS